MVADGLDVRPDRVEHERGVVPRVVLGTLAGRAVVPVAGSDGRSVELVDRRFVGRREGQVEVLGRRPLDEREPPVVPLDMDPADPPFAHAVPENRRDVS